MKSWWYFFFTRGDWASSSRIKSIDIFTLRVRSHVRQLHTYGVNKLLIGSHKQMWGDVLYTLSSMVLVTVSCVHILSLWRLKIDHTQHSRTSHITAVILHILFHHRALICLWPRFFDFIYIQTATTKEKEWNEKEKQIDRFVDSAYYFVVTITYLDCLLRSFLFVLPNRRRSHISIRCCLEFRYLFSLQRGRGWLLNWYQFRWFGNVNETKRRK